MAARRTSTAAVETTPRKAPAKRAAAAKPVAKAPLVKSQAVKPRVGGSRAAEMLQEIQVGGKALSAQIERLRHRFL